MTCAIVDEKKKKIELVNTILLSTSYFIFNQNKIVDETILKLLA